MMTFNKVFMLIFRDKCFMTAVVATFPTASMLGSKHFMRIAWVLENCRLNRTFSHGLLKQFYLVTFRWGFFYLASINNL